MENQRTDRLEDRGLQAKEAARGRNQDAERINAQTENTKLFNDEDRKFKAGENAKDRALQTNLTKMQIAQRDRDSYLEFLAKKAAADGKTIKPSDAEKSFHSNVDSALKALDDLEATVKKSGNWESALVGDPKSAADLDSLPYLIAVNAAKILDPATAAREGEVEAGRKFLIKLGFTTPNAVSYESIKTLRNQIKTKAQEMNSAFGSSIPAGAKAGASETQRAPGSSLKAQFGF
jgi:hypothetical protein